MPDTEDEIIDDTEATTTVEGTDEDNETLQTSDDEDPVQAAIQAALDAEREHIKAEEAENARIAREQQAEEERKQREEKEQLDSLVNAFGETVREIRANLKKIKLVDDDGNERELPDDFIEENVIKSLQHYNLRGVQAQGLHLAQALSQTALASLPEDARETFIRKATGKPMDEWLNLYAETVAPRSSWAKQLEKEHKAALLTAEAKGFAKAQRMPAGQPQTVEKSPNPSSKVDLSTPSGLSRALANKEITEDRFRELWPQVTGKI